MVQRIVRLIYFGAYFLQKIMTVFVLFFCMTKASLRSSLRLRATSCWHRTSVYGVLLRFPVTMWSALELIPECTCIVEKPFAFEKTLIAWSRARSNPALSRQLPCK